MELDPRDLRIAELECLLSAALARIEAQEKRIAEQDRIIAQQSARIAELEARLGMNSTNSSKPPSTDGPQVKRPPTPPTGRKRGGQPGHKGHTRVLVPPEQVDDLQKVLPPSCEHCGLVFPPGSGADDPAPWRLQWVDIPSPRPVHRERQLCAADCPRCRKRTRARIPDGVPDGGFGPGVTAAVGLLTGRGHLSKRTAAEVLDDLFAIQASPASICAMERTVSRAVAAPVEQAREAVRVQSVAHADETGWRESKKKAWLWVVVTAVATVFRIAPSRGAKVIQEMLGAHFAGRLVTDRWSAYNWVGVWMRQLCWAHLLRDFAGMVERGGVGGPIAEEILSHAERMFEWWPRVRDGTMARATFQQLMVPVREAVGGLLRKAQTCAEKKTAGMCREILKLEPALWTFIDVEGIEPTNNVAERSGRPAVLWRKGCFGTDSPDGSRYVERVLTVIATRRQHKLGVFDFLADACQRYFDHRPAPSLLPAPIAPGLATAA